MNGERSRARWMAGLTLVAGGFFLSLATPGSPAVFWGLSWSILNALALLTTTFVTSGKGQFFFLGVNLLLVSGWLFTSGRDNNLVPLLLLLPLLVPLYLGQKRSVATGLVLTSLLGLYWYLQSGGVSQGRSLALWGGWTALATFIYLCGCKLVAEVDHWHQEYLRASSQLAAVELIAVTDDLTRVFNYRYFEQSLGRLLNPQQNQALAVLMVDIDHFKEINDAHGHLTGNRVLAEMAGVLKEHTRGQDIVTRFGGEEFALILPGTDYRGALQVAERIRRAVAEHVFNKEGAPVRLTISAGLAVWPEDGDTKEELITRADLALYQAKTTGRNSVCPYRVLKTSAGV